MTSGILTEFILPVGVECHEYILCARKVFWRAAVLTMGCPVRLRPAKSVGIHAALFPDARLQDARHRCEVNRIPALPQHQPVIVRKDIKVYDGGLIENVELGEKLPRRLALHGGELVEPQVQRPRTSPPHQLCSLVRRKATKVALHETTVQRGLAAKQQYKLFEFLQRFAYNLFKYRKAIQNIPIEDERHFNAMYAMHRTLHKVSGDADNGNTLLPIVNSMYDVSYVFNTLGDLVDAAASSEAKVAAISDYFSGSNDVIKHVDEKFDAIVAAFPKKDSNDKLVKVTASKSTKGFEGPNYTVKVASNDVVYTRTRFTTTQAIRDQSKGFVGIHPNAPEEYTQALLHGANALNSTHPGPPAAMFGAGYGHSHHEGRKMPPAFSKHHKHYNHEEDEEDERPHQRRRGGFFGARGDYLGQDGSDQVNGEPRRFPPRPTNSGPMYGYEGNPRPPYPPHSRRIVPIDEHGRMVNDEQLQARRARRTREIAAEESLLDDVSDNFVERYDYVLSNTDPITRAAMIAFLASPIYRGVLENLIDKDIVFPFGFLLFRPFIVHNMATAILTKKGAETGETLIGHADFQLGDDVARKMHYGHVRFTCLRLRNCR